MNTLETLEAYYEDHSNDSFVYDYRGHLVRVEFFEEGWDVSAYAAPAEHPDGVIPDGEVHALVYVIGANDGWWQDADDFREEAEPIGPAADEFEAVAKSLSDNNDEPPELNKFGGHETYQV